MFSLLCLLVSLSAVFVQAYEPSCSQYSYVEAILERVVKVDHKMDLNHDKMTEWEKRIDEKLKEFKNAEENMVKSAQLLSDNIERELTEKKDNIDSEIGTFKEHIDLMTKAITNIQSLNNDQLTTSEKKIDQKLQDIEEDIVKSAKLISDKIERELNEKRDNIDSEIGTFKEHLDMITKDITNKQAYVSKDLTTMKDDLTTPAVMFKARGVNDKTPAGGSTMIYPTVMTNIHTNMTGGYDATTGIFTVPCTGTYLFTVQTCTEQTKYFYGKIVAAGKDIGAIFQYEDGTAARTCSTATALAVLSKGETVYVKCTGFGPSGTILFDDSERWIVFSGVLLHTGTD